jgi:hypothetical protein
MFQYDEEERRTEAKAKEAAKNGKQSNRGYSIRVRGGMKRTTQKS